MSPAWLLSGQSTTHHTFEDARAKIHIFNNLSRFIYLNPVFGSGSLHVLPEQRTMCAIADSFCVQLLVGLGDSSSCRVAAQSASTLGAESILR